MKQTSFLSLSSRMVGEEAGRRGICRHPEPSPPGTVGADPVLSLGRHFLGISHSTM